MAINALQSAATGLSALNTALDVTSNNLANINTDGFKTSRPNFQDLYYIEKARPGVMNANGDSTPTGLYVGLGVKVAGTQFDFASGPALATNRPLDLMVDGEGFFQFDVGDGTIGYSRAGNLIINRDGDLVLGHEPGKRLEPSINVGDNIEKVEVAADGTVLVLRQGTTVPETVGRIELATFANAAGLKPIGTNLFVETAGSGPPTTGPAGEESRGQILKGILEGSNVDPTRELIELIRTQRAFEMNSNSIRAADETLRSVSQLRR